MKSHINDQENIKRVTCWKSHGSKRRHVCLHQCHIHATWTHSCTRTRDSKLQKRRLKILDSTHHKTYKIISSVLRKDIFRCIQWERFDDETRKKNLISVFCILLHTGKTVVREQRQLWMMQNNANSQNTNLDRDQWFKEILQRSAESYDLKRETTIINARTLLKNQLNFVISPPSGL